jgi:hypothetical protein
VKRPEGRITPESVSTNPLLVWYAAQELGCPIPVGYKKRAVLYRRITDELAAQGWTHKHLIAAIKYMKSRGIKPRSFDYIFYHVDPAIQNGFMPRPAVNSDDELKQAVSHAVYLETDEDWTRRLLSARGTSLAKVYELWQEERQPLLEGDT